MSNPEHIYQNVVDLSIDATGTVNIANHNGSSTGLKLGGELVTATAAGINRVCGGGLVNCTASTLTVSSTTHDNKVVTLNRAAGIAVTLPAATGSGAWYRFFIGTTITTNTTTIKVANSSDTMVGFMTIFQDGGDTALFFEVGSTDDTITLDGSTKGGIKGDMIELIDVATNLWYVNGIVSGTGVEVTNLSATV